MHLIYFSQRLWIRNWRSTNNSYCPKNIVYFSCDFYFFFFFISPSHFSALVEYFTTKKKLLRLRCSIFENEIVFFNLKQKNEYYLIYVLNIESNDVTNNFYYSFILFYFILILSCEEENKQHQTNKTHEICYVNHLEHINTWNAINRNESTFLRSKSAVAVSQLEEASRTIVPRQKNSQKLFYWVKGKC